MNSSKNALLLSGGGARAAYQIGVMKAISDYSINVVDHNKKIFDIFVGFQQAVLMPWI